MQIGNTTSGSYAANFAQRLQTTASGGAAAKTAGEETAGYDFTSMTREQMRNTMNSMIRSGQMTLDQSTGLVGMVGPAMVANGNGTVTLSDDPAYEKSPVNFISQLQDAIAGAKWLHADASAKSYSQTLQVLQQYQEVGSSV